MITLQSNQFFNQLISMSVLYRGGTYLFFCKLRPHIYGIYPLVAMCVELPHSISIYQALEEKAVAAIFKVSDVIQQKLESGAFW